MRGKNEQVTGGVDRTAAGGTGRVFGRANPRSVGVEKTAVSGVELGQSGVVCVWNEERKVPPSRQGEGGGMEVC